MELKKCLFFDGRIDYLGRIVQPFRLGKATEEPDVMCRLQQATSVTELKSFIGLCNVFRQFVLNLTGIDVMLNCKLEKYQPFPF